MTGDSDRDRTDDRSPTRPDGDRPSTRTDEDRPPERTDGDRRPVRADGDRRPVRTDGGDGTGAGGGGTDVDDGPDDLALDPWGSATVSDYRKLFEEFGIEAFESVLGEVPDPHYLMRRGVIFGHREYDRVARALREGEDAAVLSGFMPTGDPHVGHKMVFDEIIWHQRRGADAYGLIADLEAHAARGLDWEEIDRHARDYLLSLLALGFDPEDGELYRQSDNRTVQDLAFELGANANFSELQAIYDFDGETEVSHMQSVVTQMADILYPQVDGPKPTVIPVGPDQDPHVRLSRDLAARTRYFGVTEAYASFEAEPAELALIGQAHDALSGSDGGSADGGSADGDGSTAPDADDGGSADGDSAADGESEDDDGDDGDDVVRCVEAADWVAANAPDVEARESTVEKLRAAGREPLRPRVRIVDRNATEAAFEALIEAVDGEKRVYDAHVDGFDLSYEEAEDLARRVEVDNGGYGFYPPSSIYHRFMTGLTGGKMSSSVPASHISLLDDPEDGYDKVTAATTGGRETAEKQRELGGEPDDCPVYELYAYLLADDDEFATRVYEECAGGDRLCGDCKEQAAELMREFLEDHQEKRAEAEAVLEELPIDLDHDSPGEA